MPPFAITTEAGTFAVSEWAAPADRVLGRADRTCRVGVSWTPEGLVAEARACPEPVAVEAVGAVTRWTWSAPTGLAGRHDLGEVWFVYPYEADDTVRVFVRQSETLRLTLPDGVDPVPFAIRAWSFVRYPADIHRTGDPEVVCHVDVHADRAGITTDVVARDCPEAFRRAAEQAITAWRFVPPVVGGEAIPSALTLSATFSPSPPDRLGATSPGDERRSLWDDGAFNQLTRDERLWFIKSTLIGSDSRDLGPGHVRVALPARPDLGARETPDYWLAEEFSEPVLPLPDHPPRFVLGLPDHPAIEVFEMPLPDAAAVDAAARGTRCDLLVQVDGARRVISWTEACDAAARETALLATDGWILRHDGAQVGESRVRFRATLVFDAEGAATVRLDADTVRTPLDALPPGVRTFREAKPASRVPPNLPRDVALPNAACRLSVEVDARGRPARVEILECPSGFEDLAARAVRRWRWRPAEEDGRAVPASTVVTIRFGA